ETASQTRNSPDQVDFGVPDVAIRLLSGLNTASRTGEAWPLRVQTAAPVAVSQTGIGSAVVVSPYRPNPSRRTMTSRLPPGLNTTRPSSGIAVRVARGLPVSVSNTTTADRPAMANTRPPGANTVGRATPSGQGV